VSHSTRPRAGRGVAVALRRHWGLALAAVMDQRKAEASYGIPDAELTPSLNWSAYSPPKLWNQAKNTTAEMIRFARKGIARKVQSNVI
jgi:hypothetical protein